MMNTGKKRSLQLFVNRLISLTVLAGFLCIQFHSLSHLDVHSHSNQAEDYSIESSFSNLEEPSYHEERHNVECPECILVKHFQVDIDQKASFDSRPAHLCIATKQAEPLYASHHHFYLLRGPPVSAV